MKLYSEDLRKGQFRSHGGQVNLLEKQFNSLKKHFCSRELQFNLRQGSSNPLEEHFNSYKGHFSSREGQFNSIEQQVSSRKGHFSLSEEQFNLHKGPFKSTGGQGKTARKRMKYFVLFFTLFLLGLAGSAQKETYRIAPGVKQHIDLFNATGDDEVSCYRIPSVVTATNGDLVVAIDERVPSCGDLRMSRDINIVIRRSRNNGKSWTEMERIVDFPLGQSASDPSMIVDEETKEIFLFYNYMDLDKEKDVYYLHYVKSADHGKTWSPPVDITPQITKTEWKNDFKFVTSGRGIYTSTGKMLHCMVNLEKGVCVFGSDDHGETWYFIDNPVEPANESKIVELADGRWMINSRVIGKGMRYVHVSADEGKTWQTRPEPQLHDPGCNASIIRYSAVQEGHKKDRLLFSHANSKNERKNLTVRISYDEGKTWSEGKTIYPGPSAYSSITVLENGDIGLFFEKDEYTENPYVRFSLKWLTDGKDKGR